MGELVLETPTTLGRFEVVRHLASGGMAEVLLARGLDPSGSMSHVVLKRLRNEDQKDERFVRMFFDEARIASCLNHPNIVRVFDIADTGECFYAMEYVHGEDLRNILGEVYRRRDKLPIALITNLVAGAAAGLHHAHTRTAPDGKPLNIVHRDVSPANILVGYDGSVKVTDFGIAKAALRGVETRSGTLKGKVSYMSPEQVTGKDVDRRSDVFALGIVLYEVATARRLFKNDNDFLTMSAIVNGEIPRPTELRPDLPRVLEDIIMTALAGLPKDRFQTADELRSELEAFTRSLGMRISPASVADYMRTLFGTRAEPWLVDDEPTITMTPTVDFDGSETGVVAAKEVAIKSHAFPSAWRPTRDSPMAYALETATGMQVPINADAWAPGPEKLPERRSRGRIVAIALIAAVVAGAGMFGVMKLTGDNDAQASAPAKTDAMVAKAEPVKAEPAKAEPAPEPPKPAPAIQAAPPPRPAVAKPEPPKPEPVKARPAPAPKKLATVKKTPPPAPPPAKPAKPATAGSAWDPNALFAPK